MEDTLTTWTLWRGDDLLGTLHERSGPQLPQAARDDHHHVNAVLVPDPVRLPLPSVRQHIVDWGDGQTVMERLQTPDGTADRRRDGGPSRPADEFWVIPPGPASPPPGVPSARQLRVRDEAGRVVPTRYVSVLEHRPDPAHLPPELASFPKGAFLSGSVWLVAFMQDSDAPAT
jgi:hypothetical protein